MNNYVLGLELLTIGMGTVFLSLYLLSVFLHFSGKLFGPESESKKKSDLSKTKDKKAAAEKKEKTVDAEQGISSEKIAIVTAAIYESLNDQKNYQIISIEKSN
jgi:sodium pump decarboxylase gamma subunit